MENFIKQLDVNNIQNALKNGTPVDADLDGKGGTALHFAAALTDEADCITVAEVLLSQGANPNVQNYYGQSSLHIAASYGYSRLVELLIVNGGDPLLGDIMGCLPVDYAYKKQQEEVVEQLNNHLDTENYEGSQENTKKFILSFWRQEVVEVPVISKEGSDVSYHSLDLPEAEQVEDQSKKLEKEKRNEDPKYSAGDSFLEASFTTRYSQFLKDLENYDHHHIDTDEDISRTLPNPSDQNCIENGKCKIHTADFMKKLQQTIQRCNHDSDSDSDIISLQRCLKKNLLEDSKAGASFMSSDTDYSLEQTLNEFDIAQLTIDITDDNFSCIDDIFEASYIPPNKQKRNVNDSCYANLKGSKNMPKGACITLNSFSEYESTFTEDTDNDGTLTDSIIIVAEKNKNNLEQDKGRMPKSKYIIIDDEPMNITAPHNVSRPEECQTVNIVRAPKKVIPFSRKCTAPRTAFKPEECLTINMVKAPKKAVPYIERCHASNPPLKNPPSKLLEKFAQPYTMKNSQGMASVSTSHTPKKNKIASIPGTPSSCQGKATPSISSSCQSYFSVVEEFIYEDPEAGIALIERRCPTSSSVASLTSTGSQMGSLPRSQMGSLPRSVIMNKIFPEKLQNKKGPTNTESLKGSLPRSLIQSKKNLEMPENNNKRHVVFEESVDSIGTLTNSIKALSADGLRVKLKELGYIPGPIIPGTQRVYQRHLIRLRKNPHLIQDENEDSKRPYPKEMKTVLEDPSEVDWTSWASLEAVMSSPFSRPDPLRHWRDGTTKSCFNYLLLDPRITQDLPVRGLVMTDTEKFQCFIDAIFYIGKGSRGRPYYHLYEAIKSMENGKKKNKKIDRIHAIWSDGVGVVSLHVFQNTIPVEAWTREAAMINAIGLGNLCNSIQGTFYGLPSTWRWAERRRLGTHLLWRAFQIFLQEGERQLRPSDVSLPSWMK